MKIKFYNGINSNERRGKIPTKSVSTGVSKLFLWGSEKVYLQGKKSTNIPNPVKGVKWQYRLIVSLILYIDYLYYYSR